MILNINPVHRHAANLRNLKWFSHIWSIKTRTQQRNKKIMEIVFIPDVMYFLWYLFYDEYLVSIALEHTIAGFWKYGIFMLLDYVSVKYFEYLQNIYYLCIPRLTCLLVSWIFMDQMHVYLFNSGFLKSSKKLCSLSKKKQCTKVICSMW